MFRIGKSLSAVILVIVFLALAGLAMSIYNSENKEQSEMINQKMINKAQTLVDATVETSNFFANNQPPKNIQLGEKVLNIVKPIGSFFFNSDKDKINLDLENLNTNITNNPLFEELSDSAAVQALSGEEKLADLNNLFQEKMKSLELEDEKLLRYEKNTEGAVIIITAKNGQEYKINLPFKFLAE